MSVNQTSCVTVCLAQRQIGLLDQLQAVCLERSEYTSRSALVRRALNAGFKVLLEEIGLDDEPDDDGGPTATLGNEMVSATAH